MPDCQSRKVKFVMEYDEGKASFMADVVVKMYETRPQSSKEGWKKHVSLPILCDAWPYTCNSGLHVSETSLAWGVFLAYHLIKSHWISSNGSQKIKKATANSLIAGKGPSDRGWNGFAS